MGHSGSVQTNWHGIIILRVIFIRPSSHLEKGLKADETANVVPVLSSEHGDACDEKSGRNFQFSHIARVIIFVTNLCYPKLMVTQRTLKNALRKSVCAQEATKQTGLFEALAKSRSRDSENFGS